MVIHSTLTTKTKLRVFGSKFNVKAVLLYGSETWRLTKRLEQKLPVFINKSLRNIMQIWWQQGALETNRAATDRSRGKTKSLGMDWPHVETRWTCSQEGTFNSTHRGSKREEDPSTPGDVLEWHSWRGNISCGMRQRAQHKIGLGGAF